MTLFTHRTEFEIMLNSLLASAELTWAYQENEVVEEGDVSYAEEVDWESSLYNGNYIPRSASISDLTRWVREGYMYWRSIPDGVKEFTAMRRDYDDEFPDEPDLEWYEHMRQWPSWTKEVQDQTRRELTELVRALILRYFYMFYDDHQIIEDFQVTFVVSPDSIDILEWSAVGENEDLIYTFSAEGES